MTKNMLKTSALVLKSINWSESSKIVSLYTRTQGRIDVIAKGARRRNSQYTGILETLNSIEAIIYFSPSRELQNLGQVSLENNFTTIRSHLHHTAYALGILELIYTLIHPKEGDEIFYDFVLRMLEEISRHPSPVIILWYFLIKLASYLGFKPQFLSCHECGSKVKTASACFQLKDGAIYCLTCSPDRANTYELSGELYRFLNLLQHTHHKKIAQITSFPKPASKCTDFLLNYLTYHTGQPLNLKSLQFIIPH
jgi:DNA repair protein RecO (recombination protein O)